MKSKFLTLADVIRVIAFLAICFYLPACKNNSQGKKYRTHSAATGKLQHNHFYLKDLLALQKQSLTAIQEKMGMSDSLGANHRWCLTNNAITKSGYHYSHWDYYIFKTREDPYTCVNGLTCYDLKSSTLVEYTTDDKADCQNIQSDIQNMKGIKVDWNRKDTNGAIYTSYVNETDKLGILTVSWEIHHGDPPYYSSVLVASLKEFRDVMTNKIDIDEYRR